MPAGQIASILAFSSSDQTSTLTTTWCALNSHPDSTDFNLSQVALATTTGSFDGGDQGLLNTHFSSWATQVKTAPNLVRVPSEDFQDISKHLPFLYNMVASAYYSYLPAFKKFGSDVKIIHFIGAEKPWVGEGGSSSAMPGAEHRKLWWQLYSTQVFPALLERKQLFLRTG